MSAEATSILEQALALPESERRRIGEALLDSVAPEDDTSIEAAWNREILRRVAQIETGEIETVDGSAGVAQIRDRLSRRRA
jgi:putative addiction module component (TIGR02574 family)